MKDGRNWIKWYRTQGVNLIPLRDEEKVPLLAWDEFKRRKTTDREVEEWLARGIKNFGAVCGSISNNLLVIDVDKKELFSKLKLGELANKTFTVRTAKGYHIYLRMRDPKKKGLVWEGREEIRFQGEGKYVVCAGSTHPSGKIYEHFITSPQEIKREDSQLLNEIERRWRKYHGIDKIEEKKEEIKFKSKRLGVLEYFKLRVSLTEVVTQYISKVKDYGTYWQGHCPFSDHDDRSPSFTVFEDTKSYYCFGCYRHGDAITFIREKEGRGLLEAIRRIEELTGVKYFRGEEGKGKKDQAGKIILPYPLEVEELIVSERGFATLRDTEELLHYENSRGGAWRFNGEAVIKEETEKILKKFGRWDKRSLQFISEVIGHVQRSTYIDRERLNTEKEKINFLNGVYDLETEQLLPHDPGYYFTYIIPVQYDPKADCPQIKNFLGEILTEDDIQTVLQFIGYCMLPIMPYHRALMFLGDGANGKSTLIELIRRFLGEKNTSSHSLQSIIEERFTKADLYGRLANLYADIPRDALRRTGIFKVLTGGDTLSAEKKFKDFFEFQNTTKLIFSANILPQTMDDTEAFFRRWLIINFPNKFEGERCDPKLLEKLTTSKELSGLLNIVLPALKQLLREGRFYTSRFAAETREEYIDKSNPIQTFVTKCLEPDLGSFETKEEVYSAFINFCREKKLQAVSKNIFGARLPQYAQVKVERKRLSGTKVYCWRGIRLKEKPEEVAEQEEVSEDKATGSEGLESVKKKEEESYSVPQTEAQPSDQEGQESCRACGMKFKSVSDLFEHWKGCEKYQELQVQETNEILREEEKGNRLNLKKSHTLGQYSEQPSEIPESHENTHQNHPKYICPHCRRGFHTVHAISDHECTKKEKGEEDSDEA